jgi:ATP-dependent DNA ligase
MPTISASGLWRSGAARSRGLVAGIDGIQFSEALATEGTVMFAHACKLGLEGIVSKRAWLGWRRLGAGREMERLR